MKRVWVWLVIFSLVFVANAQEKERKSSSGPALQSDIPARTLSDSSDRVAQLDYQPREFPIRRTEVPLLTAISQHRGWFTAFMLLFSVLLVITLHTRHLNHELVTANRRIKQATEVKSLFIANMSHEIRTPLNAVIGMTDLLQDTELSAIQREYLDIIHTSGESLMGVISDILDFSKIEAGHMELEEQDFDLVQCLEDTLDLVVGRAAEKKIELIYEIDCGVPAVLRGDAGRLRQVLLNLLSNAIKFTAEGEVGVSVRARPTEQGHQLEFAVHDTGLGIAPEKLDEIFNAFMQADISTTRKYGGTGLGLSISRRLSELMGGKLWAESRPGQGSIFYFTIQTPATCQVKTVYAEQQVFELENSRVLVVDDNQTNLKVLCAQLERWGLRPIAFNSPFSALESVRRGDEYALMISDMQMPGMDGTMLIRDIRKIRPVEQLPIIVLTSLGLVKSDASLGIAASLVKPAKPAQLNRKIMELLHARRQKERPGPEAAEACDFSKLRILVVEDNKLNQMVAMRMLDKLGCRADLANDGCEALDTLGQQTYDLVLMDIQMPNMDGLTATREIRKRFPAPSQPIVIAMSAHAAREDRERGMAAGMDDYITKPIQLIKLSTVIQTTFESKTDLLKAG